MTTLTPAEWHSLIAWGTSSLGGSWRVTNPTKTKSLIGSIPSFPFPTSPSFNFSCVCEYVRVRESVWLCVYVCVCVYTCVRVRVCVCLCMNIYKNININAKTSAKLLNYIKIFLSKLTLNFSSSTSSSSTVRGMSRIANPRTVIEGRKAVNK